MSSNYHLRTARKTAQQLQRYCKGVANHRRIDMLFFIANNPGSGLFEIVEALHINFKTASEHLRRLTLAGLVTKKYVGRSVAHTLSPYGKRFHTFLKTFSHS